MDLSDFHVAGSVCGILDRLREAHCYLCPLRRIATQKLPVSKRPWPVASLYFEITRRGPPEQALLLSGIPARTHVGADIGDGSTDLNVEGIRIVQTGLSAWVFAIVQALGDAGVDQAELLRGIGMTPDKLGDLEHRYSQEQVTSLWIAAVEATGDSNFGLKVARHIRPSTFHVVGYAMSCSATLKRAAERFAHSARLISDAAAVDFSKAGDDYLLKVDLHTGGRQPIYQTIDTMLAGFLMLCEWIQSAPVVPLEVKFRHRKPQDESDYIQIFRCPIRYGQKENSILFRGRDLEQPVPSANEELAMLLDEMAARHLAYRFASRFSTKVRDALVGQLPNGEPSKQETAKLLGMTERTLLRRLRDENTTFQELLDRLREKLAFDYLRRDDLTMEKIAYLLGFSSSSAFSRAFVRWTGQRPSEWRDGRPRLGTDSDLLD